MSKGDQVAGAGEFADQWRALRADDTIQFSPVERPVPQPPPEWWLRFLDWVERTLQPAGEALAAAGRILGISGQALMWLGLAAAALLIGVLAWRWVRRPRGRSAAPAPDWAPREEDALDLLAEADRLASQGRFEEATHLLLRRSVDQIVAVRPGLLEPATTAREIAELSVLPEPARAAFAIIAERVERSLFALRKLSGEDWRAARAAYADFALAGSRLA